LLAIAEFIYSMASVLLSTDALDLARNQVTLTLYDTPKEQCAAQEALCRTMLVLEQNKKEHFIRQLQADVDTIKAKLAFLDNNVLSRVELYYDLMLSGVDLEALMVRNKQE